MTTAEKILLKVCNYHHICEIEDSDDITIGEAKEAMKEIGWEIWITIHRRWDKSTSTTVAKESDKHDFELWFNQNIGS